MESSPWNVPSTLASRGIAPGIVFAVAARLDLEGGIVRFAGVRFFMALPKLSSIWTLCLLWDDITFPLSCFLSTRSGSGRDCHAVGSEDSTFPCELALGWN